MDKKYCAVCGKELHGRQIKYCSKKCMGLGKQNYKICPVCGTKFKDSVSNDTVCCSEKCSKIHRTLLHQSGVYYECDNLMNFIRENPDLFDGTTKQAFCGFQKIKATMEGKRPKAPSKSWKGWHLISYSENENRYHKNITTNSHKISERRFEK